MKKIICILRTLNEEGENFLHGCPNFNVYQLPLIWENLNWYITGSYYRYTSKFYHGHYLMHSSSGL